MSKLSRAEQYFASIADPASTLTSSGTSAQALMLSRRSSSKVGENAPSTELLLELIEAAGQVADHSGLKPWRLIEFRGDSRQLIGESMAKASGALGKDRTKLVEKSLRAPLVLAVIATIHPSIKVPAWEQEAVASGVAHSLNLLLHERGYGVIWRTGPLTRSPEVHEAHRLAANEAHMGWLYIGDLPRGSREPKKSRISAHAHLSSL